MDMTLIAQRNLRQFLSKASFSSAVDKQAAIECLDVLEAALASTQPAPQAAIPTDLRSAIDELFALLQGNTRSIDFIHELGPDDALEKAWQIMHDDIWPILDRADAATPHPFPAPAVQMNGGILQDIENAIGGSAFSEIADLLPKLFIAQTAPAVAGEARNANNDLLTYVLQDDVHNRLTPRVIDIAYTAFMQAKQPNDEDGGASDWFTDTRPVVLKAIEKLRKDLLADAAPSQGDKHNG